MNRTRITAVALALGCALTLAGCANAQHGTSSTQTAGDAAAPMAAGMTMPDGSIMGEPPSSPIATDGQPSASALMICSAEVRADVTDVAALATPPVSTSMFVNHLYTCTYAMPMGQLVVSVKDLASAAATTTYFTDLRHRLSGAANMAGLGDGAFGTPDGTVVLRKDSHVLEVDASHLASVFGKQSEKRADFAYEIASDILGCWTGG